MTIPGLTPPDFADNVIQFLHDVSPAWWDTIAPEQQAAVTAALETVLAALGETNHAPLINQLDDAYGAFVVMAYAAGLRHGATAEQFRAALKA